MVLRRCINYFLYIFFHKKYKCIYKVDKNLIPVIKTSNKYAGIVDPLTSKNGIDLLINKALNDGMSKIFIFSCLEDPQWYYLNIEPIIEKFPQKIVYAGCVKNKQNMYNIISDMYISTNSPLYTDVKLECTLTRINYHEI